MNPVALQVNKEVDHEDVVGLVDHVLLLFLSAMLNRPS
jgi:hypothetical protein